MKKITLLLSFIACVTFSQAATSVANIGALKTATASLTFGTTSTETYTITGEVIVTFVSVSASGSRTIYIQDATGALMIYDGATTKYFTSSPALYCGLTGITGTIKSYNGILEILPNVAPATPTSTGNTPFTPIVTTLDQLINYPLQVATVKNVTIADIANGTGVFVASKNYPLSVSGVTSTTVLRTSYADVNYIGATIPTTAPQDITGLILPYQSSSTATAIVDLIPRSLADITITTGLSTPSAELLNVSVAGKKLTVTNATTSSVEIFNTTGAKVQSLELVNGSADLNLGKGLYIVRVGNVSTKIML